MINYKTFLANKIDPDNGISEFVLNTEIFKYYKYLDSKKINSLEKEYTNSTISSYVLNIWDSVLLIFDQQKLLKNIIIKDNQITFEGYYIGMEFEKVIKLPASIYDINADEDSIYHSLYKGIKFNLDIGLKDKLFINSIEVFDFTYKNYALK